MVVARFLGFRIVRTHLQRTGAHSYQADLVGHHVVHFAGQLGTFLGQHGLGGQQPLVLLRFGDLLQPQRKIPLGLHQLAEQRRRHRQRDRISEGDDRVEAAHAGGEAAAATAGCSRRSARPPRLSE
nr:hypothetical protein [Fodinicola feengrottensis]